MSKRREEAFFPFFRGLDTMLEMIYFSVLDGLRKQYREIEAGSGVKLLWRMNLFERKKHTRSIPIFRWPLNGHYAFLFSLKVLFDISPKQRSGDVVTSM